MMLNTAYRSDTVIRAMEIITFFRRPFAICSSSHSPNPGWVGVGAGLIGISKISTLSIGVDTATFPISPNVR
jgi:hypothetical protein